MYFQKNYKRDFYILAENVRFLLKKEGYIKDILCIPLHTFTMLLHIEDKIKTIIFQMLAEGKQWQEKGKE